MNKLTSTKLKKKEIKTSLIESIEKTLKKYNDATALEKIKKVIENASGKISKKFVRKLKKQKPGTEAIKDNDTALPLKSTNRSYLKKRKGKPGKDTLKEAIEL